MLQFNNKLIIIFVATDLMLVLNENTYTKSIRQELHKQYIGGKENDVEP